MTMSLASSVSAMNAASMTKVAPCSACAGPNTAPRNEWAIMMWSRTSTANKGPPSGVGNGLAQYAASGVENIGQPPRQIVKRNRRRQQRVEPGIGEQSERRGEPPPVGPARPVRRRDPPHLARQQPQPAAVEGAAERRRHRRIAVPAHFEHGCLLTGERQRRAKSGGIAAGVNDEVAVTLGRFGASKANPEGSR